MSTPRFSRDSLHTTISSLHNRISPPQTKILSRIPKGRLKLGYCTTRRGFCFFFPFLQQSSGKINLPFRRTSNMDLQDNNTEVDDVLPVFHHANTNEENFPSTNSNDNLPKHPLQVTHKAVYVRTLVWKGERTLQTCRCSKVWVEQAKAGFQQEKNVLRESALFASLDTMSIVHQVYSMWNGNHWQGIRSCRFLPSGVLDSWPSGMTDSDHQNLAMTLCRRKAGKNDGEVIRAFELKYIEAENFFEREPKFGEIKHSSTTKGVQNKSSPTGRRSSSSSVSDFSALAFETDGIVELAQKNSDAQPFSEVQLE